MEALSQVWRNFCVSDTYEPGSPAKVLTVAAGLEENIFQTTSYFECDGRRSADIKSSAPPIRKAATGS